MKSNPATLLLGIAVGAVVVGAIVAQKSSAAPVSGGSPPPPPAPPPPAPTGPTTATTPAPGTIRAAEVASAWSSFVVLDMTKFSALYTPPVDAQLLAMGAQPVATMTAQDPQIASTVLGPLPAFIMSQLAQKNRVWVGVPQLDPTASQPESVLPMYVGNAPPAGYTEVT